MGDTEHGTWGSTELGAYIEREKARTKMPSNKQVAAQIQRIITDNGPLNVRTIAKCLRESWPTIDPEHNRYPTFSEKLYDARVLDLLLMGEDYGLFERFETDDTPENIMEQLWTVGNAKFVGVSATRTA